MVRKDAANISVQSVLRKILTVILVHLLCHFVPSQGSGWCWEPDVMSAGRPPARHRLFCPGEVQSSGHLWLQEGRHLEWLEPPSCCLHTQQWWVHRRDKQIPLSVCYSLVAGQMQIIAGNIIRLNGKNYACVFWTFVDKYNWSCHFLPF